MKWNQVLNLMERATKSERKFYQITYHMPLGVEIFGGKYSIGDFSFLDLVDAWHPHASVIISCAVGIGWLRGVE